MSHNNNTAVTLQTEETEQIQIETNDQNVPIVQNHDGRQHRKAATALKILATENPKAEHKWLEWIGDKIDDVIEFAKDLTQQVGFVAPNEATSFMYEESYRERKMEGEHIRRMEEHGAPDSAESQTLHGEVLEE